MLPSPIPLADSLVLTTPSAPPALPHAADPGFPAIPSAAVHPISSAFHTRSGRLVKRPDTLNL